MYETNEIGMNIFDSTMEILIFPIGYSFARAHPETSRHPVDQYKTLVRVHVRTRKTNCVGGKPARCGGIGGRGQEIDRLIHDGTYGRVRYITDPLLPTLFVTPRAAPQPARYWRKGNMIDRRARTTPETLSPYLDG